MIIECSYCKSKVDAKEIGVHKARDLETDMAYKVVLLECPSCKQALVSGQEYYSFGQGQGEWSEPSRLWPSPKLYFSWTIPNKVRVSLEEAERCIRAGAYIASVAMSGRALEGICRHFKTKSQYLGGGLKELMERDIIDKRLYKWGEELHKHRNIAAHATDDKISSDDAGDLFNFSTAICDYVFVLNEKFEKFLQRKEEEIKKGEKAKITVRIRRRKKGETK